MRPLAGERGAGATFLLNLSNEAWFGTSAEHDQMELQSVLARRRDAARDLPLDELGHLVPRAARRPPARGPRSLVVGGSDRAVEGLFDAQVPLYDGLTPYVRWGDWIGWVGLAGSILLLLRSGARRVP